MLAIITGTVQPNINVGQLVIRNAEERLKQYMDGICFLIESKTFSKIIFCENSGFGVQAMETLYKIAENEKVQLELLSFEGNTEQLIIHGKGYGEGEIMKYVFEHSQIVKGEKYFIKITGRMKIINIKEIVSGIREKKTYFNVPNRTLRTLYDTRMYAMPIEQFKKYFAQRYEEVMDDKGYYLEHVYTKILNEEGISVANFPRYPRIVGISGSTGNQYTYTEWKCKIKDVISIFGGYKVKFERKKFKH